MVVRLREFGVPWLEAPDGTVLQRGGKPLVLLLWLAHVAGRRYLREELAELFWPDDPPLNARKSLRQALTTLRRWVGPEALVSTGDWLWLAEGACALDAPRFRQAVRAGDWAQACALMHGPWASGAEHAGGARLERWILGERRALLAEFEALAERHVIEALTAGDHAAVCAIAQAAEALGSSHEPLMRAHVEACCAQGDFVAARTVRAYCTHSWIAMAPIRINGAHAADAAFGMSARARPLTSSASRMVGRLKITSPTRMMVASIQPPN